MSFDAFNTPEWRAMDALEMELHIAADRWHDSPADPVIVADLHRRVVEYRRARAAWVLLVATPDEAADLAADLAADEAAEPAGATPAPADPACKCGHEHTGREAGGICIGCPCEGAMA